MKPEEIQEQIDILGQRASVRVSQLQLNDPQLQNIVGQIEAYKSILESQIEVPGENKVVRSGAEKA